MIAPWHGLVSHLALRRVHPLRNLLAQATYHFYAIHACGCRCMHAPAVADSTCNPCLLCSGASCGGQPHGACWARCATTARTLRPRGVPRRPSLRGPLGGGRDADRRRAMGIAAPRPLAGTDAAAGLPPRVGARQWPRQGPTQPGVVAAERERCGGRCSCCGVAAALWFKCCAGWVARWRAEQAGGRSCARGRCPHRKPVQHPEVVFV